jgi:hypothetical protein
MAENLTKSGYGKEHPDSRSPKNHEWDELKEN